jgi:2,3-bisphosphoglycerate-independent phosphoglycerate mutase
MDHALRMARLLDGLGVPVFVHAIGDGRDVGMKSGAGFARKLSASLEGLSHVKLATVIGRHFGMDRDNRWDRTGAAWRLLVDGEGVEHATVEAAYEATYAAGDYDEYVPASKTGADARIKDGDAVILFNFRADRMRQLARCFLGMEVGFEHSTPALRALATMTSYDEEYSAPNLHVLYPPEDHRNTFGEIVSNLGLRQLRIAETEKFPHVTFFFNAGKDEPWAGEDRILVNSPKDVRSYDLKPEMSLPEVTSRLLEAIEGGAYDLIVLNMANGDLVGHCGIMEASVKAVEAVDHALSLILPAVLEAGGEAVVFADHGNCEEMIVNGQPSTAHSTNPVLCTYVGPRSLLLRPGGLADIAPTALDLMGIEVPAEMSGESLIQ